MINHIQNERFVYICMYTVYTYYVYINTNKHMHVYVMFKYIKYIDIL